MPFMWDFFSRMLTQICVVWKKNYLFEASFSTVVPQKFLSKKNKQKTSLQPTSHSFKSITDNKRKDLH